MFFKYLRKNITLIPLYVVLLCSALWLLFVYNDGLNRLFMTNNQAGYSSYKKKEYIKASKEFESLAFKGASLYRAGAFKEAKEVYQNFSTKEGKYNLGNSFLMLGEYDSAIEAYTIALEIDPDFQEANKNLKVAKARKILKAPENDGEQGTGELGADEIVFDNVENKGVDDEQSAAQDQGTGNPNWLDKIETSPQEFLQNKFRYQYETEK